MRRGNKGSIRMGTPEVALDIRSLDTHSPVADTPRLGSPDSRSSDPGNLDSRSPDFRSLELEHGHTVQPSSLFPIV